MVSIALCVMYAVATLIELFGAIGIATVSLPPCIPVLEPQSIALATICIRSSLHFPSVRICHLGHSGERVEDHLILRKRCKSLALPENLVKSVSHASTGGVDV
jgi:hypothetical protein